MKDGSFESGDVLPLGYYFPKSGTFTLHIYLISVIILRFILALELVKLINIIVNNRIISYCFVDVINWLSLRYFIEWH